MSKRHFCDGVLFCQWSQIAKTQKGFFFSLFICVFHTNTNPKTCRKENHKKGRKKLFFVSFSHQKLFFFLIKQILVFLVVVPGLEILFLFVKAPFFRPFFLLFQKLLGSFFSLPSNSPFTPLVYSSFSA